MRLARRRRRGRGVDGGEPVGHLRADHERAVAAVRRPQRIDPVRVHVGEQRRTAGSIARPSGRSRRRRSRSTRRWGPGAPGRHSRPPRDAPCSIARTSNATAGRSPPSGAPPPPCIAMTSAQPPAGFCADVPPEVGARPILRRDASSPRTRGGAARGPARPCRPPRPGRASTRPRAARRGASGGRRALDSSAEKRSAKIRSARRGSRGGAGRSRSTRTTVSPATVDRPDRRGLPLPGDDQQRAAGGGLAGQVAVDVGRRAEARAERARIRVIAVERAVPRPRRDGPVAAPRPSAEGGERSAAASRPARVTVGHVLAGHAVGLGPDHGEEGPRRAIGDGVNRIATAPLDRPGGVADEPGVIEPLLVGLGGADEVPAVVPDLDPGVIAAPSRARPRSRPAAPAPRPTGTPRPA